MNYENEDSGVESNRNYWSKRKNMMYYRYIDYLVRVLAADAKSLIDIGSSDSEYIENFDWIPKRTTLDIVKPYHSENVEGIELDFFDFHPKEKYDFATCLQVLEHIPDAGRFARKLFEIADRVLISVPYLWKENSEPEHIHDPVSLEKVSDWIGRKPSYYIVVEEPLFRSHKNKRLICYYHSQGEELNVNKLRQRFSSIPILQIADRQSQKTCELRFKSSRLNSNIEHHLVPQLENIEKQLGKIGEELKIRGNQIREINANLKEIIKTQHMSNSLKISEIKLKHYREEFNLKSYQNKKRIEEIEKRQSQLNNVKKKYNKSKRERDRFEKLYIKIKRSRSWRYMKPARILIERLKKGKR